MKIYDVSLTIDNTLVTWPGDPPIVLDRVNKIEAGANANVSRIEMGVHTGTHVDAPFHFIFNGKGIDELDLNTLVGQVLVVEIREKVNVINQAVIESLEIPPGTQRILFKTQNSAFWETQGKEFRPEFIALNLEAANYLVKTGIKLVGIDYFSISPYKNSRPTHVALLQQEIIIIEGLDLSQVSPGVFQLYCLPIKLKGSDGAPARVILIED
jgi:arylformamidase